jgi:chloramphenicol O-acetyltransferase
MVPIYVHTCLLTILLNLAFHQFHCQKIEKIANQVTIFENTHNEATILFNENVSAKIKKIAKSFENFEIKYADSTILFNTKFSDFTQNIMGALESQRLDNNLFRDRLEKNICKIFTSISENKGIK